MKTTSQRLKGFTIIEVVLVLAIASLIFLMVFVALPSLQANQRDTARKSDVGSVAGDISSYSSNNRGALPPTGIYKPGETSSAFEKYLNNISTNTTSVVVHTSLVAAGNQSYTTDQIDIVPGAVCGSDTGTAISLTMGTSKQVAIITKLEAGGGAGYCQGN